MSFTDFRFYPYTAGLFLFVLLVQFVFRRRTAAANMLSKILLLAYSFYILFFYSWKFAVVLGAVIAITYAVPLLMTGFKNTAKRVVFVLGIFALLVILGGFKYLYFFASTIYHLTKASWTDLNIILPIGISFYIFSAISYLADVYHGTVSAERNPLNVALFLAFFPKMVCGPIVKGREFIPQLREYRYITRSGFSQGIQIFAFGLFKKMVLADHLAIFVDDVFRTPLAFDTGTAIWAALSYTLQIYLDFSGYSDMAIGLSKIFGYDLAPNFNLPYIAGDVSDFWSRWHISLSDWFKEYVYIPLGGSRRGTFRTYFNLFFVMLVSGLWHGAGWTFIVWGALYGVWNCVHHFLKVHQIRLPKPVAVPVTFVLVSLLWVVFRADSFENAREMFVAMFTIHNGVRQPYTWTFFTVALLVIATVQAYRRTRTVSADKIDGYYPLQNLHTVKGQTLFFFLCGLIIMLGYIGKTQFIYGQF